MSKISSEQKAFLIDFVFKHKELDSRNFSEPNGREKYNRKWEELTDILNSMQGPNKSTAKWQKTYSDIKLAAAKKNAAWFSGHTIGTGSSPPMSEEENDPLQYNLEMPNSTFHGPEAGSGREDGNNDEYVWVLDDENNCEMKPVITHQEPPTKKTRYVSPPKKALSPDESVADSYRRMADTFEVFTSHFARFTDALVKIADK